MALLAITALAGCATTSSNGHEDDPYGAFYEGESSATYATAFPVGSAEEAYSNGNKAAERGDYDRALFEYIRGLRLASEPTADILYRIGSIHHFRENNRLAELAYEWVLRLEPEHLQAGTGLGLLYLERRQYGAAKIQLDSVVKLSSRAPWQAYNALGVLADMNSKPWNAEDYYQQALDINPGSPLILNNLGYSRYLAGDWPGAREALEAALRVNGNYELAWRNLGLVHAREKNYQFALEALGRAGNESEAYNDVGFVSMIEGDYSRALSFFSEAMRLSPVYYVKASENADNTRRMMDRDVVRDAQ
ncbi:tetratricopeptide repeat protein [Marinobacter daqiaonensis]|nr:tetratricopeptide repeat protein [Marinobacter daqiaonensis]